MRVRDDFYFDEPELEQNEELEAVAWAENHGWIVRKLKYIGRRSCPDRLFAGHGYLFLIEMKKSKGRLSVGQREEFALFAAAGVKIEVFYSGADAIAFLKRFTPSEA